MAAFANSSDRYRLLVDSLEDYAVVLLDPQGIVLSWDTGAQRMKDYQRPRRRGAGNVRAPIPSLQQAGQRFAGCFSISIEVIESPEANRYDLIFTSK